MLASYHVCIALTGQGAGFRNGLNMLSRVWVNQKKETLKAQMIRGTGGSLFLRVANTLLVIATTLVLARIMGARDYGVYAYIISWVSLLSVPAATGFDTLLVREVAKYKASGCLLYTSPSPRD